MTDIICEIHNKQTVVAIEFTLQPGCDRVMRGCDRIKLFNPLEHTFRRCDRKIVYF
ncbi:hypothetical protein [Nostoc sp.]|uniref:hypothetical protein n=1 Tax=Nostoc sp. TaxID=1180 RepID=UPI002FF7C5E0